MKETKIDQLIDKATDMANEDMDPEKIEILSKLYEMKQKDEGKTFEVIKFVVPLGIQITSWFIFNAWLNKTLEFEKTGSFTTFSGKSVLKKIGF